MLPTYQWALGGKFAAATDGAKVGYIVRPLITGNWLPSVRDNSRDDAFEVEPVESARIFTPDVIIENIDKTIKTTVADASFFFTLFPLFNVWIVFFLRSAISSINLKASFMN